MILRDLSKPLIVSIQIFSSIALGVSLYQELVEKIAPCNFCIYQRYCLCFCFLFASLNWLKQLKNLALMLLTASLFSLFVASSLHLLVQFGFIADFCEVPQVKTLSQFHDLLEKTATNCSEISLSFLWIPAGVYLMLTSSFFLILILKELLFTDSVTIRQVSQFDNLLRSKNHDL